MQETQYGYMGRLLFVNLSTGEISDERLDRSGAAENFLGGPGLGAKILYERMPVHADVFGEESMIGFVSGPLCNTGALFGARYTVVSKSPVTGGWNDANSGGHFGERLRKSGYDAIFVNGISENPVYLLIDNGEAKILDASELWGLTTKAVEDRLMAKHGKKISVALIGPAGESLSHISAVMSDGHRAAARGGSGAVMGSKKLKAVVVKGNRKTPVAHPVKAFLLKMEMAFCLLKGLLTQQEYRDFRKYGTGGTYKESVVSNDAGIKNWLGSTDEYTEADADKLSSQGIHQYKSGTYCCAQCFVGCSIHMKVDTKRWGLIQTTRPEYETMGVYGSMLLNKDVESVIMANDLCNEYGFDTISAGSTVAWAMECYERGILTKDELGGVELEWGNGDAVVKLMEMMCKGEGIGAAIAKGSQKASELLKKGAECLVVSNGIEIPQHDTRFFYGLGRTYMADPTPGRHVKASITGTTCDDGFDPELTLYGTGPEEVRAVMHTEIMNACGACSFGYSYGNPNDAFFRVINAVTGFAYSPEQILALGMRIFTIRQAFNLREGVKREATSVPERLKWLKAEVDENEEKKYLDFDVLTDNLYNALGWTADGVPTKGTLTRLGGMENVIEDLYGKMEQMPQSEQKGAAKNVSSAAYFAGRRTSRQKQG